MMSRNQRAKSYKARTNNAFNRQRFVVTVDKKEIFSSDDREEAMRQFNTYKGDSGECEFIDTWGGKEK